MVVTIAKKGTRLIDVGHEDIVLRTFILFVQTADVVLKYADANFYRKTRLSAVKYKVLQILTTNGGSMRPSEIAEWTYREPHNITTLVDRLKQDGLVKTTRNNADKRSISVTLTNKGRKAVERATPVARAIMNQVMSSITEDDATALEKSLRVLRQNAHNGLEHFAKRVQPQSD